ncbi:hypothetical protein, partial [Eggerthella sinensis]|uniref:hypothetical protein n=1 Tax=Eggerthella sinensis TaxID=242230 RepID=UPI0022E3BF8A
TLYVSAAGNDLTGDGTHDLTGDGTHAKPLATLQAAVQKASASTPTTVAVIGNLTATTTLPWGRKPSR